MKRILLIHHCGLIGGAGVSLFYTWKALQEKYEVIAYVPQNPPELLDYLKAQKMDVRTFSFKLGQLSYYSGRSSVLSPKFWYHALHGLTQVSFWSRVIKEEQPDLILVNSKVLCWMGRIFKKLNKKSVCFVRETIPGNPRNSVNGFLRNMLDDFSLVAFLSEYDLKQTGLNKAETVISPDFLEVDEYMDKVGRKTACENLGIDPECFNILFAGGVNRIKGIEIAVKAMKILKNEEINLIVAGSGFEKFSFRGLVNSLKTLLRFESIYFSESIRKFIKREAIEEKIKFIGVQKDMSLPYSACDLVIFPMESPHQARPVFEIGVQKKPAIITDFLNISEYVKNDVNGLTFEPHNPEALAKKIMSLKNNKELLCKLGERNYEYTMKYHTKEYAINQLVKKIDEICKD